ncbi:AraC family transcriptional regulator [Gallaecimonas sp. GXIMD4217]|uniref:AraC family transcriptional regulator n=1 Tax=Gallaecimonas sp. GXIMD4217 TaxID=3131927 RepID=UPI00311ACA66
MIVKRRQGADISAGYLRALFLLVEQKGAPSQELFRLLELTEASLQDAEQRFPAALYDEALNWAANQLNEPLFGLLLGLNVLPGDYGVLGHQVMNCHSLGEAITRLLRFQSLVADLGQADFSISGEQAVLCWQSHRGLGPQVVERNMAGWLKYARFITGRDLPPRQLLFCHEALDDIGRYEALLNAPVQFGRQQNALVFPKDYLELPLPQANEAMLAVLDHYADTRLQSTELPPWTHRVQAALFALSGKALLSLEQVALELGISERSLQRRLQEEGQSFKVVLDDWRRQQCEKLARERLPWIDVALRLGYAEQGSLVKACQRWFGCTPGELRSKKKGA